QFVSHIRERLTLRVCDTQRVFTQHVFKYCGGNRHFLFLWVSGLQVVLIDASDGQRMPCRVVEACDRIGCVTQPPRGRIGTHDIESRVGQCDDSLLRASIAHATNARKNQVNGATLAQLFTPVGKADNLHGVLYVFG
ncbi:hypothetical protein ACQX74_14950, partial [Staphylococcus aureus]|uniref:hypothetical protein n=1 Tax=Staphylococcus aureus TaxID=1280 RepID=UPI003D2326F3